MKIYTKTGDTGETSLFAGARVRKDHPRIEAYGTVDELSAAVGLAAAGDVPERTARLLEDVQRALFRAGAELATPVPERRSAALTPQHTRRLEEEIDRLEGELPPLKNFILPGGAPSAAALHLARAICRRAERRILALAAHGEDDVSPEVVRYINRLGDLLFMLARDANAAASRGDVVWKGTD